jgi:class 3 adenylate cyclase
MTAILDEAEMLTPSQMPERYRRIIDEEGDRFGESKNIRPVNGIPDTSDIPLQDQAQWLRIPDVICVYVDMKNSTKLGAYHHDRTTAAIYQLFTGTAVRLFDEFESPYIDVKGDGVFALFDQSQPHRALAAAVTFKTFAEEVFIPKAKAKVEVDIGAHIGIDQRTVLVRKIGLKRVEGRTDRQNEVWAGKPVNMGAKLASRTSTRDLLVSDRFHSRLTDDKARMSCGCPGGTKAYLWQVVDVSGDTLFDFDNAYRLLSIWCKTHGSEYCEALLSADK